MRKVDLIEKSNGDLETSTGKNVVSSIPTPPAPHVPSWVSKWTGSSTTLDMAGEGLPNGIYMTRSSKSEADCMFAYNLGYRCSADVAIDYAQMDGHKLIVSVAGELTLEVWTNSGSGAKATIYELFKWE